ncbi:hypothetical protein NL676_015645 [Syzygium grande]|nr:hypothetical protein NL676_015645 [Syzygium grande]
MRLLLLVRGKFLLMTCYCRGMSSWRCSLEQPSPIWARAHSSERRPRRSGRRQAGASGRGPRSLELAVAQTGEGSACSRPRSLKRGHTRSSLAVTQIGEGRARLSKPWPRSATVAQESVSAALADLGDDEARASTALAHLGSFSLKQPLPSSTLLSIAFYHLSKLIRKGCLQRFP